MQTFVIVLGCMILLLVVLSVLACISLKKSGKDWPKCLLISIFVVIFESSFVYVALHNTTGFNEFIARLLDSPALALYIMAMLGLMVMIVPFPVKSKEKP